MRLEEDFRFYQNRNCDYFPCHSLQLKKKGISEDRFNCKFCFCPLYPFDDCGGDYEIIESKGKKIKDCSACLKPHLGYSAYENIKEEIERRYDFE